MSTPYLYNIKGSRGSYNTEINGWEIIVTATLTGIIGVGDDADVKQIYESLTDSAIPNAGEDIGLATGITDLEGCWLRKIESDPLGNGEFRLTLTYQSSQWGILQIDVGSQLSQIETTKYLNWPDPVDLKTENIKLQYTYPADYGGDEPSEEEKRLVRTGEVEQGGTVVVLKPEGSRIYTVRESVDPAIQQALYEGKVNDNTWWFRTAREWLCTSISGTSDNSGKLVAAPTIWITRYEFQRKIGGWDPEAVYSDDITGIPVPDAESNIDPKADASLKTIDSYDSFDFTILFPTP